MLEKQNVTLSIPKSLLRKAKIIAINHETSLSGLLVDLLTDVVEQRDQYAISKRQHLALLAEGFDMGTNGNANWTRDSLHER